MPVGELLARVSSRELAEWMAFYEIEPWDVRADWRAGNIAAILANAYGDGSRKITPKDFIWPDPEPPDDRPGWARLLDKVRAMHKMMGGR